MIAVVVEHCASASQLGALEKNGMRAADKRDAEGVRDWIGRFSDSPERPMR